MPLNTPRRLAAIEHAQTVASGSDAHLGNPNQDLKRNLRRFGYVLEKFGITVSKLGITAHGLRHEALIEEFVVQTGHQPPVRGGVDVPADAEKAARLAVSRLAGHSRPRASTAYLGAILGRPRQQKAEATTPGEPAA